MAYPKSGLYQMSDGRYINLADILGARLRPGSRYGALVVGTMPTLLQLDENVLNGRHYLQVINVGEQPIYVGFDEMVTVDNGLPINGGEERGFELDPTQTMYFYAVGLVDTEVRLVEVV